MNFHCDITIDYLIPHFTFNPITANCFAVIYVGNSSGKDKLAYFDVAMRSSNMTIASHTPRACSISFSSLLDVKLSSPVDLVIIEYPFN